MYQQIVDSIIKISQEQTKNNIQITATAITKRGQQRMKTKCKKLEITKWPELSKLIYRLAEVSGR